MTCSPRFAGWKGVERFRRKPILPRALFSRYSKRGADAAVYRRAPTPEKKYSGLAVKAVELREARLEDLS